MLLECKNPEAHPQSSSGQPIGAHYIPKIYLCLSSQISSLPRQRLQYTVKAAIQRRSSFPMFAAKLALK
jgi:hypothetical protein